MIASDIQNLRAQLLVESTMNKGLSSETITHTLAALEDIAQRVEAMEGTFVPGLVDSDGAVIPFRRKGHPTPADTLKFLRDHGHSGGPDGGAA